MKEPSPTWIPFTLVKPEEAVSEAISSMPGWVTDAQKQRHKAAPANDLFNESVAINAELLRRAQVPSDPERAIPIWILSAITKDSLASLNKLALTSNTVAGVLLSAVLRTAVNDLNSVARQYPELFEDAYQRAATWPVLYSPNPQLATNVDHLKGRLEHLVLNITGNKGRKGKDLNAKSTRLAVRVYECIDENRHRWLHRQHYPELETTSPTWVKHCGELEEFSSKTVKAWAEVGWEILLFTYEGHPERDPELGSLRTDDRPNAIRNELTKALKRLCKTGGER